MLIRGYGEYWSPDLVDWGERGRHRGRLPGRARPAGESAFDVDVWEAMAIYVLWNNYQPVYVGKATGQRGLGPRMRDHLADRLSRRWDLFSWFSLSKPLRGGGVSAPGIRQVGPADVLSALEAFAQRLELPLNRRMETLPGAVQVEQTAAVPAISLRDIQAQLNEVVQRLDRASDG